MNGVHNEWWATILQFHCCPRLSVACPSVAGMRPIRPWLVCCLSVAATRPWLRPSGLVHQWLQLVRQWLRLVRLWRAAACSFVTGTYPFVIIARPSVAAACFSVLCSDRVCAAHVLWFCDHQHSAAFSREYGSINTPSWRLHLLWQLDEVGTNRKWAEYVILYQRSNENPDNSDSLAPSEVCKSTPSEMVQMSWLGERQWGDYLLELWEFWIELNMWICGRAWSDQSFRTVWEEAQRSQSLKTLQS